ncbi:hypothetical protein [Bordetella bronchialis]|nr:hypothetical protein [Bordetella bronchialis]
MMRLKGKYLEPIRAFANELVPLEWHRADAVPAFAGVIDLLKRLHGRWLGEADARSFLFSELAVFSAPGAGVNGALSAPENAEVLERFVRQLQTAIESLPRNYWLEIELARFPKLGEFCIPLAETVELVGTDERFGGNTWAGASTAARPDVENAEGCCYLRIRTSGYGSSFAYSQAVSAAVATAKHCALFLLRYCACVNLGPFSEVSARCNLKWDSGFSSKVFLSDSVARFFGGLEMQEHFLEVLDSTAVGSTLLTGRRRTAVTAEEKIEAMRGRMWRASGFLQRHRLPHFAGICAAMEWYFDSITVDNQTLAYLAACIGLEALLGYGAETPDRMEAMSVRLGDRYGFLMGQDRTDREKLAAEYRDVLAVRGHLVHARKPRLTQNELDNLRKAQEMLGNVIWKEVSTLLKSPTD